MIDIMKRLFKKNENNITDKNSYITLLDIIEKKNDLIEGGFANINNDIATFTGDNYPNNVLMSYAYARRAAAAGLFLQGIFTSEDYLRANMMFKQMQLKTYVYRPQDVKNVHFQEKCYNESLEFIMSYDKRLRKEIIGLIVLTVEQEDRESLIRINDYNTLIEYLYTLINNGS